MYRRDYSLDENEIESFLLSNIFSTDQISKYRDSFWEVAKRERSTFYIYLDDIKNNTLRVAIEKNVIRFQKIFTHVLDRLFDEVVNNQTTNFDSLDCYLHHLKIMKKRHKSFKYNIPRELSRRFTVSIIGPKATKPITVRELKAPLIGSLLCLTGLTTKVGDVKPWISVATYTCDHCGFDIYQLVQTHTFTPAVKCGNVHCEKNTPRKQMIFQGRGSRFIQFQEVRIQEHANDIPPGTVPRQQVLWCLGEQTRQVSPGECVEAWGVYIPVPKLACLQYVQGLLTDSIFWVLHIKVKRKALIALDDELADDSIQQEDSLYEQLWKSIAPEIYGCDDLKKAIALMLVGGTEPENLKIRKEINICVVGDPGLAKSQLLAFVCRTAESAQYVSGKGSSSAGLTASVMRDPITSDTVLEGGSLVLADGGFCCIDEFDTNSNMKSNLIGNAFDNLFLGSNY